MSKESTTVSAHFDISYEVALAGLTTKGFLSYALGSGSKDAATGASSAREFRNPDNDISQVGDMKLIGEGGHQLRLLHAAIRHLPQLAQEEAIETGEQAGLRHWCGRPFNPRTNRGVVISGNAAFFMVSCTPFSSYPH